tara:strand:+ start:6634 stop:7080 length:447 start_codon:yes stop_codon:yes gene_type:complete
LKKQKNSKADKATDSTAVETPKQYYSIDIRGKTIDQLSVSMLIARRCCFSCKQTHELDLTLESNPKSYIQMITDHCKDTSDYLLPDTPLKEAIFRIILASGNRKTTAKAVEDVLASKWSSTAYPRNVSEEVIQSLLDQGSKYGIVKAG